MQLEPIKEANSICKSCQKFKLEKQETDKENGDMKYMIGQLGQEITDICQNLVKYQLCTEYDVCDIKQKNQTLNDNRNNIELLQDHYSDL